MVLVIKTNIIPTDGYSDKTYSMYSMYFNVEQKTERAAEDFKDKIFKVSFIRRRTGKAYRKGWMTIQNALVLN